VELGLSCAELSMGMTPTCTMNSLAPGWPLRAASQPSRKLLQPNGFEWGWRRVACQGFIECASRNCSRAGACCWYGAGEVANKRRAQKERGALCPSALHRVHVAASAHAIVRSPDLLGLIFMIVGLGGRSFAKHHAQHDDGGFRKKTSGHTNAPWAASNLHRNCISVG
jgi:hypothetical protein